MDADPSHQSIHYFPDSNILGCPGQLAPGQAFSIQVIWMLNVDEIQTITSTYDNTAEPSDITHQTLTPLMRPKG